MWIRWDKPNPFSHGRKFPLPAKSEGTCKRCGKSYVDLGDGLCVKCWDRESRIRDRNHNKDKESDDDALQSES